MFHVRSFPILILFSVFLISSGVRAESLDLGAVTEFPALTGAEARFHFMENFTFSAQGGFIISPYVNATSSLGQSLGFFDSNSAQLIQAFLPGTLELSAQLAYENLFFKGFLLEFGYAFMSGGGGSTANSLLSTILGRDISPLLGTQTIQINGQIHSILLRVGYRWEFAPQWSLLFRAGVMKPIGSMTTAISNGRSNATINTDLTNYMANVYQSVYIPLASVAILYRFGGEEKPPAPLPVAPRRNRKPMPQNDLDLMEKQTEP